MALGNFYLTDAGNALLAEAQAGAELKITRAQIGEGTWPVGTTYANITTLVTPVKYLSIVSKTESSGQAEITVQFTNSGVGRSFSWTEFGLWAADPDYPDDRSHDILYGTAYAGEVPVPIDAGLTEFLFNVLIKMGSANNVTVVVDSSLVYMTREDAERMIEDAMEEIDATTSLPDSLAEDMGLGDNPSVNAAIASLHSEVMTIRDATQSEGLITIDGSDYIETGTTIKLRAPADSETITLGISIDGITFPIVDSKGTTLNGVPGIWSANSVMALLIDKVYSKAYLINNAGHTHASTDISGLTASRAVVTDNFGKLISSSVTDKEIGYLDGVTSNVQTQLNGKAASNHGTHVTYSTVAPAAAGTASAGSASTVARSDHVHPAQTTVSGNAGSATKLATARTIQTNLGLTTAASFNGTANVTPGVTGTLPVANGGTGATTAADARTNLGAQATITGGASTITSSNLTANRALVSNGSGKVAVSAVTATELGYLDGVTSAIQTQLNGKAASSHGTHVTYSTTAPKAAGTASAGSAATVARSDHVHPLQTTVPGNTVTFTDSQWSGGTLKIASAIHKMTNPNFGFVLRHQVSGTLKTGTWATLETSVTYDTSTCDVVLTASAPYSGAIVFY